MRPDGSNEQCTRCFVLRDKMSLRRFATKEVEMSFGGGARFDAFSAPQVSGVRFPAKAAACQCSKGYLAQH
jgi:hypothetical protein